MSIRPGPARCAAQALIIAAAGLASGFAYAGSGTDTAPPLHFVRIGTEGGPPPAVITALHQDRNGLIWIGSRNGLIRFDGYGYEQFQHDPTDPGSISDSTIRTIYEDRDGTLWFGTNTGGLNRFDASSRTFVSYRHDSGNPRSLSHDSVYAICRDRRGVLWVGTQKGLNRYDPISNGFDRIVESGPEGLQSDYILTLYEDRQGRLWIGTSRAGLHRWDDERRRFQVFRHDPANPASLPNDRVIALLEDDTNGLWVGTIDGLFRKDPERPAFRAARSATEVPGQPRTLLITSMVSGAPGQIWVGTHGQGLASLDTATGRLRFWTHDPGQRDSLSEDKIIALLAARSGAIWIGTWGGGLNRLSPISQQLDGPGDAGFPVAGMKDSDVTAILRDRRGEFWAGTRTGFLVRLDPVHGRGEIVQRGGGEGLSHNVLALEEDRLGRIWIGASSGLMRLDPGTGETKRLVHDPNDANSLGPGYVAAVLEDRNGRLWVGTGEGGVQRIDAEGRVLQRFKNDPRNAASLSDDYVTALLDDRRGSLWVGTRSGGLNELDPATGRARRFLPAASDPSSLGHHYVTSLLEDSRGRLWVGTAGGGLNRVDRSADGSVRFVRVTEQNGLIDDDVTGVLEDDDGSLWVTTRRGLSRFHPDRNAFTNVFVSDGLPSAEFESSSAARGPGLLCFGTVRGLVAFKSGTEFLASTPSAVVVRSLRTAAGERRAALPGDGAEALELPYGDWLSIELAVLDFSPEREHRYAYRFDDKWIDIGSRREITFTSLKPGKHALRIRGRNSQGVWGEAKAPLEINVVPPFWMTIPFQIVVAALVGAAAFGAHRRRTSVLKKRHRELVELDRQREHARGELDVAYQRLRRLTVRLEAAKEEERKRIARELHDELGPTLTAVIINLQLLGTHRKPDELVRRIEETVELVDRMIQRIRDISLDLRPPLIDELGLVPALGGYLESVSERTGIKIAMRSDKDLGTMPAHVPITVFRVVQEAVTNVIRHAGSCRVEVAVHRNGHGIDVRIEDDGSGFDVGETMEHAASGKAIGLLGMQERVGMIGGEITIDSTPGSGTRIHVRLPLSEAA